MKTLAMAALILAPLAGFGQELVLDTETTYKAEVVQVLSQETKTIPGTETEALYQTIEVEIRDGARKGERVTVQNDYLELQTGDVFYLLHSKSGLDGRERWSVGEPYRIPALAFFALLFVACVIFFGGWQGIRGLLALAISFFFIAYLLLPGILSGLSPALVAIGVSALIIIPGSYITHGFNKTTSAAVLGMIATIALTGILAALAISATKLSGFGSEEALYLHFNTRGGIDFAGLLLGGILIGLLGILYDAAIGQAVAVEELRRAAPDMPKHRLYARALRIGREHIGALVNSLAIAYVGASLALLLLYMNTTGGWLAAANREVFAAEIIRTLVGSIGLILAVPITTLVSVWLLEKSETHHK